MKSPISIILVLVMTIAVSAIAIESNEKSIVGYSRNKLQKGRNVIPVQFSGVGDSKTTI